MEDHRMPRKILNEEICGRKKRGRRRKRWITDVEEDLRRMSVRGWRLKTKIDRIGGGFCRRPRSTLDCSAGLMMICLHGLQRDKFDL
jgi:hypothetical protein